MTSTHLHQGSLAQFLFPPDLPSSARLKTLGTYTALALCSVTAATGLFSTSAVHAQVEATAHSQNTINYAISAGSLSDVLAEFAAVTGIQVLFEPNMLAGINSTGLRGNYRIIDGFDTLLDGSGITYRFIDATTIRLERSVNQGPLTLAPITVRGELQERNLQDAQTSVAVINGEALEQRASESLYDISERIANVASENIFGLVSIRGIRSAGLGGGGGALISTRVDGAALNNGRIGALGTESTWDLEQIEILRGPQSTQSGRNALAGAVEIRSKDPNHDFEGKSRLQVGNADTLGVAVALNTPVVEDRVAFRISVDHEQTDGFIDNPTLGVDDFNKADQTTMRAGLRFDPSNDLSAILKYTHAESDGRFDRSEVDRASFPEQRVSFQGARQVTENALDSINLRIGYDVNDAFRVESETTHFDGDTLLVLPGFTTGTIDQEQGAFEQEFKLLYQTDRTQAVMGVFYAEDEFISASELSGPALILGGPPTETVFLTSTNTNDATNYAVFAEVEHRVLSGLRLIAGGRYDRESRDVANQSVWSSTDPTLGLPPSGATDSDTTYDAWLPKISGIYEFTPNYSLGFTLQRGYRAGSSGINLFTGEEYEVDPEFTWNYELSLRSQWLEDRLTLNANVFYTDWTDQQVRVAGPSGNSLDFTVENAGESRLFGGEIEFEALVGGNLELFVSLGYTDTGFEDYISGGEQLEGNEFPHAPEFTAAFGGTWYFMDDFFFSADASFQDDIFSDVQNIKEDEIGSRFLVNARLGYERDSWSVSAYVDNGFDKDYEINIRDVDVIVGDPLTFGVIVQYQF